jgi:hypothetical protein
MDNLTISLIAGAFFSGLVISALARSKRLQLSEMAKAKAAERVLNALDLEKNTYLFICEEEYERYLACKKAEEGLKTPSEKISK